jgi:hypothetical protein
MGNKMLEKITQKFTILLFVFLLVVSAVYAIDIPPIVEFAVDSTHVKITVQLQAVAVDTLTNPGILWIKLYEDNVEIASKNCAGLETCVFVKDVTHTEGGNFTYFAKVLDKGGHTVTSDSIEVEFEGYPKVYIADDGSTYYDSALTNLAQAKPILNNTIINFNPIILPLGYYTWNVQCYDDSGRSYWADNNFYFRYQ